MKKSLHIAPYCVGSTPNNYAFHLADVRRRSGHRATPWFMGAIAAVALFAILFLWVFSVWPRGPFKNSVENWLSDVSQTQTMGDYTTIARVAHYTDLPPEGWRVADANEVKYLFDKGLTVEPNVGLVTASKSVADAEGFTYRSASKIFARFSHGFFVKGGGPLVKVAFLEQGQINVEPVPAAFEFWNCKTVLVPQGWKRPIDVQGDKRVATADNKAGKKK